MKFRSSKTSQWELFDYHFGSGNLCNSSCIVYSAIISHTSTYVQSIIWLEQQLFSDRLTSASEWVCVCMWMCKLGLFPCFITHTLNRCLFKHIVPASICVETCYTFKTSYDRYTSYEDLYDIKSFHVYSISHMDLSFIVGWQQLTRNMVK